MRINLNLVGLFSALLLLLSSCGFQTLERTDAKDRKYLIHVPENLPDNAPLLFALHGFSSQPLYLKIYSGLNKIADREGFVVVYPQGTRTNYLVRHWNASLDYSDVDDVGFIKELAAELEAKYNLNPDETFLMGMSNGGFMAFELAAEAPEVFEAFVSVVGLPSNKTWPKLVERKPTVPMMAVGGEKDGVVKIDGSMRTKNGWGGAPPLDSVMHTYASFFPIQDVDTTFLNDDKIQLVNFKAEDKDVVRYYRVGGMHHRYPGRSNGMDTAEAIWSFLEQFTEEKTDFMTKPIE